MKRFNLRSFIITVIILNGLLSAVLSLAGMSELTGYASEYLRFTTHAAVIMIHFVVGIFWISLIYRPSIVHSLREFGPKQFLFTFVFVFVILSLSTVLNTIALSGNVMKAEMIHRASAIVDRNYHTLNHIAGELGRIQDELDKAIEKPNRKHELEGLLIEIDQLTLRHYKYRDQYAILLEQLKGYEVQLYKQITNNQIQLIEAEIVVTLVKIEQFIEKYSLGEEFRRISNQYREQEFRVQRKGIESDTIRFPDIAKRLESLSDTNPVDV